MGVSAPPGNTTRRGGGEENVELEPPRSLATRVVALTAAAVGAGNPTADRDASVCWTHVGEAPASAYTRIDAK